MNQFGAVPGETPQPRNQMCSDEKESENEKQDSDDNGNNEPLADEDNVTDDIVDKYSNDV